MAKKVVFIDARVAGLASIVSQLVADTEAIMLDARQVGLLQMQRALAGRGGLDSIHVVSHGAPGALQLGSTLVDTAALAGHAAALRSMGQALTASGDILLYGCGVAQGALGQAYVGAWARATGADVAASVDATGPAAWGGNLRLESTVGAVETQALALNGLNGLLGANSAPTFSGADGKVVTDLGGSECLRSMAVLKDGRILLMGNEGDNGSGRIALARYLSNGTLDTSFDGDGKLLLAAVGQTGNASGPVYYQPGYGCTVTLQPDGKMLLPGFVDGRVVLTRLNADGSQDAGFGVGGKIVSSLSGSYADGSQVALQADGKILLAAPGGFVVARYNTDGTLDTSFGRSGKVGPYYGYDISTRDILVLPNGNILMVGLVDYKLVMVQYNANGKANLKFGVDSMVVSGLGSHSYDGAVAVQADGKIVAVGYAQRDIAVKCYNADGSLDAGFGNQGLVTTRIVAHDYDYSEAFSVALQADGKIVVAGESHGDVVVVRYLPDGRLDTSFDGDGKVITKLTWDVDRTGINYSVAIQADGKILVSTSRGEGYETQDFQLLRYNTDGSLDLSFSPAGDTLPFVATYSEPTLYPSNFPVELSPGVHVFDAQLNARGNYGGATLTLARHGGADVSDVFSTTADSTLSALVAGNQFSVDGVIVGRVLKNAGGQLVLSFNTSATQTLVDRALQQIGYSNSSDAPPAQVRIDWIFSDGNTGSQGTGGALSVSGSSTVRIIAANDAPVVSNPLPDRSATAGRVFEFKLPANSLIDPDRDALTFALAMSNGSGVPPWLKFDTATGTLRGTPGSADMGTYHLRLTARDGQGASVHDDFQFTVTPANVFNGTSGNDNIVGQASNDILNGLAGDDTLDGGAGSDTMTGGDGSDIYYVRDTGDTVTQTNATAAGGIDTVWSFLNAHVLGANIENGRILLPGAAGLTGNNLNNVLFSGAGDNVLDGAAGADTASYLYAAAGVTVNLASALAQDTGGSGIDTLRNIENVTGSKGDDILLGNAGANTIDGGAGADFLVGRDGHDTLAGGAGLDTLVGGSGQDAFRFADLPTVATLDAIADFNTVDDRLEFDDAVFKALGPVGAVAAGTFVQGRAALDRDDRLLYDRASGELRYDADGSGTGAAVLFARLSAGTALNAVDLFVV
ncbi:DUF4347 domain-containing protein [Azohydromonas aeria]|uniref:DUF4347 domain-containing protein n=1 Tax=Azohydromonas aeria TaxID=2590212 RepID=UPI0012FB7AB4|nr:DUF4347 domain-containing protein [Azohydromonas aeria]